MQRLLDFVGQDRRVKKWDLQQSWHSECSSSPAPQVPFSAAQKHKSACSTTTTPAWRTEETAAALSLAWETRTRGFIASQLGEMCQERLK